MTVYNRNLEKLISTENKQNKSDEMRYNKYLLELKEEKAERQRERYDNLNIELVCPICNIESNLNKINIHFKGKKCSSLNDLLTKERQLQIKQKINRLTKTATNKELTQSDRQNELIKILEE